MARTKPFVGRGRQNNLLRMVHWTFDIPPDAVHDFVADMRAYHAETGWRQRDQIAARQAGHLNDHMPSRRMTAMEVREVFMLMEEWC